VGCHTGLQEVGMNDPMTNRTTTGGALDAEPLHLGRDALILFLPSGLGHDLPPMR
jgi:hypothetical protein